MNQVRWREAAAKNWYWLLIAVLCVAVGAYKVATGPRPASQPGATSSPEPSLTSEAEKDAAVDSERPSDRDRTLALIAEYKEKVAADPKREDAPALLVAMGNLYRQRLDDSESAAECYARVLVNYPDWPNKRNVYADLEACYKRLEDKQSLEWLYKRMMADCPEDSQEHQYAKVQLGL